MLLLIHAKLRSKGKSLKIAIQNDPCSQGLASSHPERDFRKSDQHEPKDALNNPIYICAVYTRYEIFSTLLQSNGMNLQCGRELSGKKYPLKPVESPTATTCQECTQIYPGVAWKKRAYIKCTYTTCNQSSNKSATSMTRLENNLPRNKRHHLHHIVLPAQNFLHCFLELHRILWVCFADIRE